ncbi:hypothetical protein GGR56DRAFT_670542 [Xylariaceae sp. FL0804]|nr:hypothetical protein GGR56DRAFT_670542 [Xylariaceae sp. FL0804]
MSSQNDSEDGPWDKETSKKFNSKAESKYYDPCQEAAELSLRCINRNPDNKALCSDYFEAYRECKRQWTTARHEEKRKRTGTSGRGFFG